MELILDYKNYLGMPIRDVNEYDYLEIGNCECNASLIDGSNFNKINYTISNANIEKDHMYKLGNYHPKIIKDNSIQHTLKLECSMLTYFSLLKKFDVKYVDLLKINTGYNDYKILNDILDELSDNPLYILPKYIYIEHNCSLDKDKLQTILNRLNKYGYVHIYTTNNDTFVYNCANYFLKKLQISQILLETDDKLLCDDNINFFQNVHSYVELGICDLFKNILKNKVTDNHKNANVIWTTQSLEEHNKFVRPNITLINIIHGGGHNILVKLANNVHKPNIIVKSIKDFLYLKNLNINVGFFIGKYKCLSEMIVAIHKYRVDNYKIIFNKNNFLMLNTFFNNNHSAIVNTYGELKNKYLLDSYGADSSLGWTSVMNVNIEIENNVLTKYKFFLHLKGIGYLCNSVIFACMVGMPIIMSRENYVKTLYSQFIPPELIIFYDNYEVSKTNPQEIISAIDLSIDMSIDKYMDLSTKLFIHGTYFRENFNFEINHLFNFLNKIKEST